MSFVSEKFLPSGTYIIINAKYDLSIACHVEDNVGSLVSHANKDFGWKITLLAQKKWIIQSCSNGFSANMPPDAEEEDEINAKPGQDQPHQWVIKRRQATDTYITDESSWWKFSKVEEPVMGAKMESHPEPLPVSVGKCLNLVRIHREVQGILEVQSFISSWDSVNEAMVLDTSGANSCVMQAVDEATVVVLELFHTKNTHRRNPLSLPAKQDVSSNLWITSIFDGQSQPKSGAPSSEPGYNAIVMVHLSVKMTVDLNDPGKPTPGNYKIIFVIDDSGSMSGGRWKQVRAALAEIGKEAMQYDADGVDVCFINSPVHKELVKVSNYLAFLIAELNKHNQTQEEILSVYDQVQPSGFTPTGAKLEAILGPVIEKLDAAVDTQAYGHIKPADIIVLTDGVPTDDPAAVIQTAAQKLDEGLHHMNAVGIQFVQIGNDEGADQALMALCNGPVRVRSLMFRLLHRD
ncbi:uncharacterized protein LACBIDRAFT_323284 [Laccaria bicolor S238N-H82]|uniref:Predicted protein n=1 Tax=Laccaria bicolor (strain S238N-H82 / ATCC MYA-4686) TaxID=486041 RepID=B0CZQ4_LACBS|nr:uncharacterized protein LACBIDRAFT_323284 [Laccaria bicolor S238N-H82]EDR12193.1 predicted protein [Laccaria bicolor S238N-H82]|eukprot:XP_001876457.1 predicted protein [Laccaria bicolor S238N-H82]